ncbi:MAG: ferredoxin [Desulfobacterales bacterium]
MKIPVVELGECTKCGVCVEVCPDVFSMSDAGFIVVADLESYSEKDVDDAIKNCPENCIYWEEN